MEWFNFEEAANGDSLFGFLANEFENKDVEWSIEENKLFENALAEFEPSSRTFFENIASRVPGKSVEEIQKHYQALVEDIELIESGRFPIPEYEDYEQLETNKGKDILMAQARNNDINPPRRRGVPWTEDEHRLFLMGLNKYGKGDWRSISRYYVITKTPTQVASHAQKYFRRQNCATPPDRRRPSIHDIQTVNSTMIQSSSQLNEQPAVPSLHPYGLNPMFNNNCNINGFGEIGAFANDQESMPMNSTIPDVNIYNAMMNQPLEAYPPSYFQPSFMNNQWE